MDRPTKPVAAVGLDLGTSGLKAVLVDGEGTVLARASRTYPVATPQPGAAETDPALWERSAREATAEVFASAAAHEVVGVGVDGQMHGLVLIDADGEPVRDAVLWPDSRATGELERWRGLPGDRRARLANPLTPGMFGPVLAWLARTEPERLARTAGAVLPKDWLRGRLLADPRAVTDATDASATLLWDVVTDDWDHALVADLGVPVGLLPAIAPSAEPAGRLSAGAAAAWGLPADLPVATGCGDVAATLVGSGARDGELLLTVGTGAQAVLPGIAPVPAASPTFHTYRAVEGWFAMGALLNAGLVLDRVVAMLGVGWEDLYRPYDRSRALPGFLPFAAGERLPEPLAPGSAGWHDIGLDTEPADLVAAAVEGVVFAIRRLVEALPTPDGGSDSVAGLAGGGARSPMFARLLADVLQRPLRRVERPDATAVGAAVLGLRAAGHTVSLGSDGVGEIIEPTAAPHLEARYQRFLTRVQDV